MVSREEMRDSQQSKIEVATTIVCLSANDLIPFKFVGESQLRGPAADTILARPVPAIEHMAVRKLDGIPARKASEGMEILLVSVELL